MDGMDEIIESRIAEAMARGDFDNLPGEGKPLQLDDDSMVPEELRVAYRLLKNSNYLPPQIRLRHEIADAQCLLANSDDESTRAVATNRLTALLIRLNVANGKSANLRTEQCYFDKLVAQSTCTGYPLPV
ncbi:MAG: DUF1992 domain-containing protein [Gammaproteobacteria bacterium]|nr:DUF1992 domain-containing protein [Gammaproteobacteria bacterium]